MMTFYCYTTSHQRIALSGDIVGRIVRGTGEVDLIRIAWSLWDYAR